jgi:hypothetical protein
MASGVWLWNPCFILGSGASECSAMCLLHIICHHVPYAFAAGPVDKILGAL